MKNHIEFPFIIVPYRVSPKVSINVDIGQKTDDPAISEKRERKVDPEFVNCKLEDFKLLATLGMGGFGRVELVSICWYCQILPR